MKYKISEKNNSVIDVVTLFAVCFMGYGVKLFEDQANLMLILIIVLNFQRLKYVPQIYINRLILLTALTFSFFLIKHMYLELWIIRSWVTGVIICCIYKDRIDDFISNFERLAHYSAIYTLIHVPVYLLFGASQYGFCFQRFYIFWYNNADWFMGVPRVQGFAWEPSCWSYILIINLIFCLHNKRGYKSIIIALMAILLCNSTTVIMSTAVVILIHAYFKAKKIRILFPVFFAIGLLVFPFFQGKLLDKLESGSGLARLSDFYILLDVMATSPLIGADAYGVSNSKLAFDARERALIDSGLNINEIGADGYFGEEMVNDFAALLVQWGIVLGPFILFLYLLSPLIKDFELKLLLLAGTIAVITGSPITRTPIFFLFPVSVLIMDPTLLKHPWRNIRQNTDEFDKNKI